MGLLCISMWWVVANVFKHPYQEVGQKQQPVACDSSECPPVPPLYCWWFPSHSTAPLWDSCPEQPGPETSCRREEGWRDGRREGGRKKGWKKAGREGGREDGRAIVMEGRKQGRKEGRKKAGMQGGRDEWWKKLRKERESKSKGRKEEMMRGIGKYRWINGWEIDSWMDGWTDGQTDRQTDRQIDR